MRKTNKPITKITIQRRKLAERGSSLSLLVLCNLKLRYHVTSDSEVVLRGKHSWSRDFIEFHLQDLILKSRRNTNLSESIFLKYRYFRK